MKDLDLVYFLEPAFDEARGLVLILFLERQVHAHPKLGSAPGALFKEPGDVSFNPIQVPTDPDLIIGIGIYCIDTEG